jgi:hypothetical protein
LSFRQGQASPLVTPPACGSYTATGSLTPWSDLGSMIRVLALLDHQRRRWRRLALGGVLPFSPYVESEATDVNAGSFSALTTTIGREDGNQDIQSVTLHYPQGLSGILSGVPFCPEQDIALARTKPGAQEEAEPSCPQASELRHSQVGTGVGAMLAYTPGKIYLASPYEGDPFSLVSVTSAVVGPFDIGDVVLRFALRIDPS